MTNPLSAPENTSLALSVRSSEDPQVLKNGPPLLSAPSTAITSIGSAPNAITKATPPALAWDGPTVYEDEGAPLSERDSIFATHYITSDTTADNPQTSTAKGRHDGALDPQQDAVAKMELPAPRFPHSPEPAPLFHKTTSSPTVAHVRGFENGLDGRRGRRKCLASTESASLDFLEYYQTRAGSLDRVGRGARVQILPPFISPVDSPINRPSTPRENPELLPMSGDGAHNTVPYGRKDERPGRGEQVMSTGEGRSSSHHENGHVEKRIAASLAKTEPAQNPRSRKTSHYLGLFKENNPSQEHRRRDEKGKEKTSKEKAVDPGVRAELGEEVQHTSRGGDSYFPAQDPGNPAPDDHSAAHPDSIKDQPSSGEVTDVQQEDLLPLSGQAIDHSPSVETMDAFLHGNNERVQSKETEIPNSASGPTRLMTQSFPLCLLEEIRNHHNLTPGAERGTSFSRSIPTISAERAKSTSGGVSPHPTSAEKSEEHDGATADRDSAENEDEDESDKEQISSALYFPHQTPVLEGVERGRSDRDTDAVDIRQHDLSLEPDVNVLQRRKIELEEPPSNEVDIDLQSADQHRHLHGDIPQQQQTPLHDAELQPSTEPSSIGSSSASNSDYESVDERALSSRDDDTNLTDDADTTPTATPLAHSPLTRLKSRSPRHHLPAPLGAVELKPYSHQVGGHTTVFRFSRRAVCKQLSNRENEFYETVERRHPELLRFLPRYAWFSKPSSQKGFEAETSAKVQLCAIDGYTYFLSVLLT